MDKILGIKIDNLTKKEIFQKIEGFLAEPKFHQIATVNPEFILEAQKNLEFRDILNRADLSLADGFGIKCAFWRNFKHLKLRLGGADILPEILEMAQNRGLSVFLACRKDGLTDFKEAKEAILKEYPKLEVVGENIDQNIGHCSWVIGQSILICNFGAPHQERFIKAQKNDKIRLAVGVGGALDFMSGKIKRAPIFFRSLGLEWFWRFLQEPRYRFQRICRAVIVFPVKVLINKK